MASKLAAQMNFCNLWGCTSQMRARVASATRTSGTSGSQGAWSTTVSCWACGLACGCWAPILWVGHWARAGGSCSLCRSLLALVSQPPGCSSPTSRILSLGTSSWHRTQAALGQCSTMSWLWSWVASIVGTKCSSMTSIMRSPMLSAPWASVAVFMAGRKCTMQQQRCCTVACGSPMAMRRHRCRRHRRSVRSWWSRTSEDSTATLCTASADYFRCRWNQAVGCCEHHPYVCCCIFYSHRRRFL